MKTINENGNMVTYGGVTWNKEDLMSSKNAVRQLYDTIGSDEFDYLADNGYFGNLNVSGVCDEIQEEQGIYAEVKCDYYDPDGFWCVDAYWSNNPDAQGTVVAVINPYTGGCYAIKDLDSNAKCVIEDKVMECIRDRVEILAAAYNELTDAQKDEFLRLTGNN